MRTEVLAGQLLDLVAAAAPTTRSGARRPPTRCVINRFKTAAYTVERPLQLGAALAGAPPDTVAALRSYGADIGVAFQLRDDLLGVYGDPAVTGKPAGDDLVEGKRTLLLATARARAGRRPACSPSSTPESVRPAQMSTGWRRSSRRPGHRQQSSGGSTSWSRPDWRRWIRSTAPVRR